MSGRIGNTAVYGESGKGFTLIELLIVIAIIGVLSSIVLVLVDESRENGRNSARNSAVEEYVKALELVHTNAGSYVGATTFQCIGDYPDDSCWTDGTAFTENAAFQTALAAYIQPFAGDYVNRYEGMIFRVCPTTGNGCTATYQDEVYEIRWFLEGTNRECVKGQTPLNGNYNGLGITYCQYAHL